MNRQKALERVVYGAVIVLSVAALVLVAVAATQFSSVKLVYQGF